MFAFILRSSLLMLASFAGCLTLLHLLQFDATFYDEARIFLTQSENCADVPCFLGVTPGETPALEIDDVLLVSQHVQWAEVVDVMARLDHVNWRWSGTQPEYLQAAGRVDISGDAFAGWLTLMPELSLAQLLLILGEPQHVGGQFSEVLLRYPQYGFLVRLPGDCASFWHLQGEIEIRALDAAPASATLDARHRALCTAHWP